MDRHTISCRQCATRYVEARRSMPLGKEDFATAITDLSRLLEESGLQDDSPLLGRSLTNFKQQRLEQTVRESLTLLKADSRNSKAYLSLGVALDGLHRYAHAWVCVRRSLRFAPETELVLPTSVFKYVEKHMKSSGDPWTQEFYGAIEGLHECLNEVTDIEALETEPCEDGDLVWAIEIELDDMIEKHDVPPELEVRTSASHADGSVALDAEALASVGVPVTIISGFQNVGKTTFLQYLVNVYTSDPTRRVGIVLNHQSESSAENSASVGAFAWLRGQPNVVVVDILGSIWSTARDVFIEELNGLAARENLHYIFVEASSTTDLLPLAQVFMSPSMNPRGRSLHGVCTLDTTVCVVDASDFLHKYYGTETLKMIGMNTSESDERAVVDVLLNQIEFADVILINKCDLVEENGVVQLVALLRSLNARAIIEACVNGLIPVDTVVNTGLFDEISISMSPGWAQQLMGNTLVECTEHAPVQTLVYRRQRSFHPARLWAVLQSSTLRNVFRTMGHFWIASNPDLVLMLSTKGPKVDIWVAGEWVASRRTQQQLQYAQSNLSLYPTPSLNKFGSPLPSPLGAPSAEGKVFAFGSMSNLLRARAAAHAASLSRSGYSTPDEAASPSKRSCPSVRRPLITTLPCTDEETSSAEAFSDSGMMSPITGISPRATTIHRALPTLVVQTETEPDMFGLNTSRRAHAMEGSILRWHPKYGDRRVELSISGVELQLDTIEKALDWALITAEEESLGAKVWQTVENPMRDVVTPAQDLLNLGKVFLHCHATTSPRPQSDVRPQLRHVLESDTSSASDDFVSSEDDTNSPMKRGRDV